ncbi:MAG TPA: hypothetical protein VLC09_01270 [Polyangiaceae bacterium]|nr:hypothetical protein [Polyangiaceae bacterium]
MNRTAGLGWLAGLVSVLAATACANDGFTPDDDSTTTGTGGASAATGGGPSTSTGGQAELPSDCSAVTDACPFEAGIEHHCVKRFGLGVNYAWRDFASDFGGLAAWSLGGVTANAASYDADLALMRENGASIVRWWMFPDLRGDGVLRDGAGSPTGLSETAVADIHKALELAAKNNLSITLTLFSFDDFRPTRTEGGVSIPGLSALLGTAEGRTTLVNNVVVPAARAVASSPNASALFGWDVINEPEWAIAPTGSAPTGGEFDPNDELTPVALADMKAFISEALTALAAETPTAERSVGWAAAKWAWAFTDITGVTFHQPHIYAWVNDYWPYTTPPADLGYGPGPVVMGEFYMMDGPFGATPTFQAVLDSWYTAAYAGAWAWDYYGAHIKTPADAGLDLSLVGDFATAHGCSVSY